MNEPGAAKDTPVQSSVSGKSQKPDVQSDTLPAKTTPEPGAGAPWEKFGKTKEEALAKLMADHDTIDERFAKFEKRLEDKDREIGRLGDEVGRHRQLQMSAEQVRAQIDALAEEIRSDDSEKIVGGISKIVKTMMFQDRQNEVERVRAFDAAQKRSSSFKDIEYEGLRRFAILEGMDFDTLTSVNAMERAMMSYQAQRSSLIDFKTLEQQAYERGRQAALEEARIADSDKPSKGGAPASKPESGPEEVVKNLAALHGVFGGRRAV